MDNWPEARRREVMVYAVRELSKWSLLGEPLPTGAEMQVKIFEVWKEAMEIYPDSGFGNIPGRIEGQYCNGRTSAWRADGASSGALAGSGGRQQRTSGSGGRQQWTYGLGRGVGVASGHESRV